MKLIHIYIIIAVCVSLGVAYLDGYENEEAVIDYGMILALSIFWPVAIAMGIGYYIIIFPLEFVRKLGTNRKNKYIKRDREQRLQMIEVEKLLSE